MSASRRIMALVCLVGVFFSVIFPVLPAGFASIQVRKLAPTPAVDNYVEDYVEDQFDLVLLAGSTSYTGEVPLRWTTPSSGCPDSSRIRVGTTPIASQASLLSNPDIETRYLSHQNWCYYTHTGLTNGTYYIWAEFLYATGSHYYEYHRSRMATVNVTLDGDYTRDSAVTLGQGNHADYLGPEDPQDYYKVPIEGGLYLTVRLTSEHADVLRIDVDDDRTSYNNQVEVRDFRVQPHLDGFVYVRVHALEDLAQATHYTLDVRVTSGPTWVPYGIGIAVAALVGVGIGVVVKKRRASRGSARERRREKKAQKQRAAEKKARETQATRRKQLIGMIKLQNRVPCAEAAKVLGVPTDHVKKLLYELAAEGKVEGSFDGDVFSISSDVDAFVNALETEFQAWSSRERAGEGKI